MRLREATWVDENLYRHQRKWYLGIVPALRSNKEKNSVAPRQENNRTGNCFRESGRARINGSLRRTRTSEQSINQHQSACSMCLAHTETDPHGMCSRSRGSDQLEGTGRDVRVMVGFLAQSSPHAPNARRPTHVLARCVPEEFWVICARTGPALIAAGRVSRAAAATVFPVAVKF